MKIEEEIFNGYIFNKQKAISCGFTKINDNFVCEQEFLLGKFIAKIVVNKSGEVSGSVIEKDFMEEYNLFRVENVVGEFALKVKRQYTNILLDIRENCFYKTNFVSSQANEVSALILDKFGVSPEYMWEKYPHFGIFRCQTSKKWFALIMNLQGEKLDKNLSGEVDVLNVKLDEGVTEAVKVKGVYPCYHMNKKYWVTIILNNTLSNDDVMKYIEASFNNCE